MLCTPCSPAGILSSWGLSEELNRFAFSCLLSLLKLFIPWPAIVPSIQYAFTPRGCFIRQESLSAVLENHLLHHDVCALRDPLTVHVEAGLTGWQIHC